MRKMLPLASLALGLASYCLLLLISQEATLHSLAIMGVSSFAIVILSMGVIWDVFRFKAPGTLPPASHVQIPKPPENEMYLEIIDE